MSGSSLDGVDAALVEVGRSRGRLEMRSLGVLERGMSPRLRDDLQRACEGEALAAEDVARLSESVARSFARAATALMESTGFDPTEVDAIASHGHTLCHRPGRHTVTMQIGSPALLAELTGLTTISDFRTADTAAGGEGAPLAPFVHHALFSDPRKSRAIQNLGGIGNVTLLRAGGGSSAVRGSDTGPGNMLIDGCVSVLSGGEKRMDRGGRLAASAAPDPGLVEWVLKSPFFRRRLPASTGREDFGARAAHSLVELGHRRGLDEAGIVSSATMATAAAMVASYRKLGMASPDEIYVCGGGAKNPTLMAMIARCFPASAVDTIEKLGGDSSALEAQAFGVLGYCFLEGVPANLPAVTGASGPRVLGCVSPGANYARVALRRRGG